MSQVERLEGVPLAPPNSALIYSGHCLYSFSNLFISTSPNLRSLYSIVPTGQKSRGRP